MSTEQKDIATFLIYDQDYEDYIQDSVVPKLDKGEIELIPYKNGTKLDVPENAQVILYLDDEDIQDLSQWMIDKKWKTGFLPHPKMDHVRQGFGISSKTEEALDDILSDGKKAHELDLLYCNGQVVFDSIIIGEALSSMFESKGGFQSSWKKLKNILFQIRKLKSFGFVLQIEGKKDVKAAGVGILLVQHGRSSLLSRKVLENSHANDGMFHALILSPRSIIGLIQFTFLSIFAPNRKFPPYASHIRSGKINIKGMEPMSFILDGSLLNAKEIQLEVKKKVVSIYPGRYLEISKDAPEGRESFKTDNLPKGETAEELKGKRLPFIDHASTEEFKDLFIILRDNSKTKSSYLVLMILSTILATFGLFADSTPVVIGAMILAPLMSPIISLSMGVLRQMRTLIIDSLITIGWGLLFAFICAVVLTWFTPLTFPNDEILSRIRPNLLDLGIAVGAGIAGAYAHSRKEVAQTLAGTAIAVALVPPLAVSGIGLGWMDWDIFFGAFLLLMTNLSGMVIAGSFTFLLMGFSPFRLARKGLVVFLIIVGLISVPLSLGFSRMVKENKVIEVLDGWTDEEDKYFREIKVRGVNPVRVSLTVVSTRPLVQGDLEEIKSSIEDDLGEKIELELTVSIRK